jgi:hypothetical protein
MGHPPITEYSISLSILNGDDFQDEVSARLRGVIIDFQPVPSNPQGDAGIDGFSHHGERAYCCYGPEQDAFKKNKDREKAIVDKFREDLLRIFELEPDKGALKDRLNTEMKTILPDGKKIKHTELIVNWFESHRVLNPILSAAAKYAEASACRYVEKTVTIKMVGPRELANQYAVDEVTIARARQRVLVQKVEKKAEQVALGSTEKFDKKMADLKEILPGKDEAIDSLRIELQNAWRKSLAFEQELGDTLPSLHRELEANRARILTKVSMVMVGSDKPWTELEHATEIASELLRKDFDKLFGMLIEDVSSGEIARLIGECPVGWEKPVKNG